MPDEKSSILLLTRHCPFDIHDGSGAYIEAVLSQLNESGHPLSIAWSEPSFFLKEKQYPLPLRELTSLPCRLFPRGLEIDEQERLHPKKAIKKKKPSPVARLKNAIKRQAPVERSWSRKPDQNEIFFFQSCIDEIKPRYVIANYAWIANAFKNLLLPENCETLVFTHDAWHAREELDTAARNKNENNISKEDEMDWLNQAGSIISISQNDKALFQKLLPLKRHIYLPKPATVKYRPSKPDSKSVLFVGSNNKANRDGIKWFIKDCWQIVAASIPEATLDICGSVVAGKTSNNINAHGRVENLQEFYENSALVIVPLREGSGMKIKLVEAAAYGRCIVSTSIGLQGMDFMRGSVTCQDQPAAFAKSIIHYLNDPDSRQQTEQATLDAIEDNLAPESALKELNQFLN